MKSNRNGKQIEMAFNALKVTEMIKKSMSFAEFDKFVIVLPINSKQLLVAEMKICSIQREIVGNSRNPSEFVACVFADSCLNAFWLCVARPQKSFRSTFVRTIAMPASSMY